MTNMTLPYMKRIMLLDEIVKLKLQKYYKKRESMPHTRSKPSSVR